MSRINTNVNSLIAQRILTNQNKELTTTLERLSTGSRINRGGDDPAGLIVSENLRSQKAAIGAAIGNAERAEQVVNIAEGGLQEISTLLLEVQSLVGQTANDAGMSQEEKEANQLQVDSILQTVDRIAEATSFQGTKLLNGNFDFSISGQDSSVVDYEIKSAKLNTGDTRNVQMIVTASAQTAGLYVSLGGTSLDLSSNTATFEFEVAGTKGARQFSFSSGTNTSAVAAQINSFTDVTGVSAVASSTGLYLNSNEYGSTEFVSIDVTDNAGISAANAGVYTMSTTAQFTIDTTSRAALSTITNAVRDEGQDLGAVINGVTATADGLTARISNEFLDVEIELDQAGGTALGAIDAFTITGGGAKFNLGPNVDIGNQVSVGIGNIAARKLGSVSTGYMDQLGAGKSANLVNGDLNAAQEIVNTAIKEVSTTRGRLGAFQKNVIGTTIRALGVTLENTTAAESMIRDTDFAAETANLTRSQILVQATQNALSISNSNPQNVLALL
ncbi:flagellin N-terminal helical domain-containing protein [Mucisphaera calidilacus]|uniref:Flagellin n=1 Tax=Mucisphaera calidilacus TaxID=2527982 RepID=A0A518BZN1_9BACT|nr:flagellin [Mucisphaera calidilacus]QDU72430.1 Flagellar filament 33 kDa core protein [Mucisphaera calidilacus]